MSGQAARGREREIIRKGGAGRGERVLREQRQEMNSWTHFRKEGKELREDVRGAEASRRGGGLEGEEEGRRRREQVQSSQTELSQHLRRL